MGREIFDPTAADAVYTYTNFIIGTKLEAIYSFQVKQAMVTLQRMCRDRFHKLFCFLCPTSTSLKASQKSSNEVNICFMGE